MGFRHVQKTVSALSTVNIVGGPLGLVVMRLLVGQVKDVLVNDQREHPSSSHAVRNQASRISPNPEKNPPMIPAGPYGRTGWGEHTETAWESNFPSKSLKNGLF